MRIFVCLVVMGMLLHAAVGTGGAGAAGGEAVTWEGTSAAVIHVHEAELDGEELHVPVTILDLFTGPSVSGLAIAEFAATIHLPTGGLSFAGIATCMDCTVVLAGAEHQGTFVTDVAGAGTLEAGGTFTWVVSAAEGDLAGLAGAGDGTFTPVLPLVDHLEFSGSLQL